MLHPLWPHQERAIRLGFEAELAGHRNICITIPTGGGKRRCIVDMANQTVEEGGRPVIFTERRIITRQTVDDLQERRMDYGMVACGYPAALGQGVLVVSVQTADRRGGPVPDATRVFVDEAHRKAFDNIIAAYRERGVPVYGFTATPIGLKGRYETLVIGGSMSDMRACGALVPCRVFSPEMPWVEGINRKIVGKTFDAKFNQWFTEWQTDIFGDAFAWWQKLNPFGLATLVFAPGIKESNWMCQEFIRRGVTAEHVDGSTSEEERADIFKRSMAGETKVISSCGVLREGADMPWMHHGILLQPCRKLITYLQIVGRLLRAFGGKPDCVLQDHAGAMYRFDSPNEDREWKLEDTEVSIKQRLKKQRANGEKDEPIRCPKCGGERRFGNVCPHCKHQHAHGVRLMRMLDGSLKEVRGKIARQKAPITDDQACWTSCLFMAAYARGGLSLKQARVMFFRKAGHWPPFGLKNMPAPNSLDWDRMASDVYPWLLKRKKANA